MLGKSLKELGFTEEVKVHYSAVKEAVFPFIKFPGMDFVLSPEMRSTGEVMGIDTSRGLAYLKSQLSSGGGLPTSGNIFVSLKDSDKELAIPMMKSLSELGFTIYATQGTSTALYNAGVPTKALFRISAGRPNLLDLLSNEGVHWIITTSEQGEEAKSDEIIMRSQAVVRSIPITTTIPGIMSAIVGITERIEYGGFEVCSLQEYHRHRG